MAVNVTHTTPADGSFSATGAAAWNASHSVTLDSGKLLGRSTAGTGAAEEIAVGTGLSLSSGTLSATGSGGMVYPGAGIPNSTGSAWDTSYSTTGSGTVVALATSPAFTTPSLGVATATSVNGLTVSTTTGTLTLANGSTLATSGANSITFTSTAPTTLTLPTSGTLATTSNTVASFSGGTTGLTPSSPTTGAVTLGGTLAVANGGTGTATPALVAGAKISVSGSWPNQTISTTGVASSGANSDITSLAGLTTPLSVAQGGSGTATPSLVAGTNITISGSWPNQTINATASGSVTSVTASSPLASSGGATPDISLTGVVTGTYGGTGVNNGSKTITLGGNFTTSGAFNTTLTATADTSLTLPASGYVITSVTNMSANPVTGTPSNTTFLRGDGTWATVSGSMVYPGAGIPNSTGSAWDTSYSTTGSGTVVALATSPVFTTPSLGVATATSVTFPDAIQITAAANRGQIEQMRLGAFT